MSFADNGPLTCIISEKRLMSVDPILKKKLHKLDPVEGQKQEENEYATGEGPEFNEWLKEEKERRKEGKARKELEALQEQYKQSLGKMSVS
jgi:hypothetical protein